MQTVEVEISDRKAFDELRQKQVEISRQLINANGQLTIKERTKKKSELTLSELNEMPETTKMYKSIGRTFVLSDGGKIKDELQQTIAQCETDIANFSTQVKYLERQAEDNESNIRELIKTPGSD
eukprot:TRINITY_DN641_c0_g2_i3.p2 TRINITY_DN641_c0_g2~~TRINITY_DN641_c0_g2_i3.p2  ORF type:complete len:124 (-),score=34.16 TRINITY_DN641_c0_g2_i3:37-408(-)